MAVVNVEPRGATSFEERLVELLAKHSIDAASVASDSVSLVPFGRGFMLRGELGVLLEPHEVAALFAESASMP